MKNFLKIIVVNFVIICLMFIMCEFVCIYFSGITSNNDKKYWINHYIYAIKSYVNTEYFKPYDFREPSIKNSNKKPIITMGCSYAYGLWLDNTETLASIISEKTNRSVYNLGVIGTSPREMLYILRDEKLRNEKLNNKKDFEYIIYPYISHHLFRLYIDTKSYTCSPYYKQTREGLEFYRKNPQICNLYTYKKFLELKYSQINNKESFELFCLYLKEINKEIKEHFNNTKLVILVYEDYIGQNWEILEKEGIIIVKVSELIKTEIIQPQYTISLTDIHPNAKAWQTIVPALVKELELNK